MKRRVVRPAFVLALLGLAAPVAGVQAPRDGTVLRDFDARFSRQHALAALATRVNGLQPDGVLAGSVEPGERRQAALLELERLAEERVDVRWSPLTGSPAFLHARSGWLSKPDGRPTETVARDFVLRWRELFALSPAQVVALEVGSRVPLAGGGSIVHFEQRLAGLPVDHGHLAVAVGPDGRVLSLAGGGVTGAGAPLSFAPVRTGAEAVKDLLAFVRVAAADKARKTDELEDGAVFLVPGLAAPLAVRLRYVPTAGGPRLAWGARVDTPDGLASYEVLLDDVTGLPIRRLNLMRYLDTRGRVFRVNPNADVHEIVRFPDADDYRTDLSPAGWVFDDLTIGNNVTARDDRDADNEQTPGRTAQADPPGPYLAFDFPFSADPTIDLDQSITQLFWAINASHDRFHRLGFDEASGNFQVDNFGRPGLGGDPVLGDTQDGSGTNNANFNPLPEGTPSRMQMFIWDVGGNSRDSSNDVGVVIHEYAHGVSSRLVGGPQSTACLAAGQGGLMGEGWSDYYASSFLEDPVIGGYLTADGLGIRIWRLDENPPAAEPDIGKDYGDYCEYPNDDRAAGFCEVHDNGEMWAGFLWLIRESLVSAYGESGKEIADRLTVEAMKLTPCSPSMLDARDAIVLADRLLYGGAHACLIRAAAADRGMGFSASSTDGQDTTPVAANDQWPECLTEGTVAFTREGLEAGSAEARFSCADQVAITVTDGNAVGAVTVTVSVSSGDSETLLLSGGADRAVFTGSLPTAIGAPAPEDGTLQVADGDTLDVLYSDPDVGIPVTSSALIDCTARIRIVSHRFTSSTCDDDSVAGFPELPGFLDQGEVADLVLTLANDMPLRVQGGVSVTTDWTDIIAILPAATALPVDLPAAAGATPGLATVTVRIGAADDLMGATTANVLLNLQANGFDPNADYTLPLELNLDYELRANLQIGFDVETEVGLPVGPEWSTGLSNGASGTNEWTLVECSAATGSKAYRNGPDDCTGDYTDDQGSPWLATPTLQLGQANSVAARLVNVSFVHDVVLGAGGFFPIFDADAVGVIATTDPAAEDTSDPQALAGTAIAVYANLAPFGLDSNTMGWEPQSVDVGPDEVSRVDLLQPFQLAWYFLNDITPSEFQGFPIDVQGPGYYLDDLIVTYDVVNAIPSAAVCAAGPTALAIPVIADPVGGVGCSGSPVLVDASRSEVLGCPPPRRTEFRFVDVATGSPVACFDDGGMATPRTQDADGWGDTSSCWDFPVTDRTYLVEVRCQAEPTVGDGRTVSVQVLAGTAIANPTPNVSCQAAETIDLDASESAVAGCPGGLEYRWLDGAGAPLDCDGDGNPDDWGLDDACALDAPAGDLLVGLVVRCADLPDCEFATTLAVPQLNIAADAAEEDPAASPYCPGSAVPVTAAGTVVTGCDDGQVEYRWTAAGGVDTGWRTNPAVNLVLTGDADVTLTARCSIAPDCPSEVVLPVDVREGAFELALTPDPLACAGDPLSLGVTTLEALQCAGAPEYRFLRGGLPMDCDGDGTDDGWGPADTCETVWPDPGDPLLLRQFRVDVRCDTAPACALSSPAVEATPTRDGLPQGAPQGTLRVTKTGDCPPAEVVLDWSDSGRSPAAFAVIRSTDPTFPEPLADHVLQAVDGLTHADGMADCTGGPAVSVLHYRAIDRNSCTDEPIRDF